MKTIFLKPGNIYATSSACILQTVLGSCVSLCLQDSTQNISGMNHYLLPHPTNAPSRDLNRYGIHANKILLQKLIALGANKKCIAAKIYGGGNILENISIGKSIGEQNILLAREFLANEGIPLLDSHVGGDASRRISFQTIGFMISVTTEKSDKRRQGTRP